MNAALTLERLAPVASRLLALRLAATEALPLAALRDGREPLVTRAPDLATAMSTQAPRLADELRGPARPSLARAMGRGLTRHLMRRNQYLPRPADWDARAEALYLHFLGDLARSLPDDADAALRDHQARLRALLAAREGPAPPPDEPVCAFYDPALQLRLLRLDPLAAPSPILDLGCGADGALVHQLRAAGRGDAWGLDPLCETGGPLIRASWFDAPLVAPRAWGTIVAHQSLTLHVLRAHLSADEAAALRHVRLWRRVLDALAPGGALHCAPALPFLEDLLPPDRWEVARWSLPVRSPTGRHFEAACVRRRL